MNKKMMLVWCLMAIIASAFISSSANSECGWVLWKKTEYIKTGLQQDIFWEIIDAFPDYNRCLQGSMRIWQVAKKQAVEGKKNGTISEIKEVPGVLIIKNLKEPKEIMSVSEHLYCLPGTLDPRERK